ncbi:MAG TPA: flagellar basal body rod C-terminal domain-containing protein, partial [Pseudobdellovibrionaceae bacterium]|nr:flagellar basal body rod C-terminal domain-containing protein [Pseudobdellovibrionaceae bacterium]
AGGEDPESRVFTFTDSAQVQLSDAGEVFQGQENLGQLSVVDVADPDSLMKIGNSMYGFKPNMNAEVSNVERPSLKQGFLEMSNVNIVKEMTDMITANRVFESTQKAISTYDQMADKVVNVVGKTGY